MKNFSEAQIESIRSLEGDKKVLLALPGGMDSSVAVAMLLKAISQQLVCACQLRPDAQKRVRERCEGF